MTTRYQEETTDGSNVNTNASPQPKENTSSSQRSNYSSNWQKKDIGGLWHNESKNGQNYLCGKIRIPKDFEGEYLPITILPNKFYEEGTRKPQFRAFRSDIYTEDM